MTALLQHALPWCAAVLFLASTRPAGTPVAGNPPQTEVQGVVTGVNYRPHVRNGRTLLSFSMSVEGRPLRVITPFAGLVSLGDRVRVTGTLDGADLDATNGDLEVTVKAKRPTPTPFPGTEGRGVPTEIIPTRWGRTLETASLVSSAAALLALLLSMVLHWRRFNVDLASSSPGGVHLAIDAQGNGRAEVELRLFSTGSLVPYLTEEITLRVGALTGELERAQPVTPDAIRRAFPLAVDREVLLRLSFALKASTLAAALPVEGAVATIRMRDSHSRARFRIRALVARVTVPPPPTGGVVPNAVVGSRPVV